MLYTCILLNLNICVAKKTVSHLKSSAPGDITSLPNLTFHCLQYGCRPSITRQFFFF